MNTRSISLILAAACLLAACGSGATAQPTALDAVQSSAEEPTASSGGAGAVAEASEPTATAEELAAPATWSVVDTGQDYCYSDTVSIPCPAEGEAYYGQDAQYQGNAFNYQDNGDGTVTDLVTGLMWAQDPGDKVDYAVAVANADSFSLAGYDDWRLPTIKELYSLIDQRGQDASDVESVEGLTPYIDDDVFVFQYGIIGGGVRYIDSQWATSSVYGSQVMNGVSCFFGVNFADGRIKCYPMQAGGSGGYFALYVRGEAYGENNFVDNGDGTITDAASGLVWQQDDSGSTMNWEPALDYCANLSLGGRDDWRLPDAKELQSIVDYSRSPDITNSAAIDPIFNATGITNEAGQADWAFYWTSTTHLKAIGEPTDAVYIAFGRAMGYIEDFGGWVDVHGAGAQRSDPKTGSIGDFPVGMGPQGDARRAENMVRCVAGGFSDQVIVGGGTDPNASSAGNGAGQGDAPTPPQEAIDACSGLSAGDACSIGPNEGTCSNLGGVVACQP